MIKKLLLWLVIFILGFIVGTGAGFKILEGVSGDLLEEALHSSVSQFQQAYSGSATQQTVDQQKDLLMKQLKGGLKDYIMKLFGQ